MATLMYGVRYRLTCLTGFFIILCGPASSQVHPVDSKKFADDQGIFVLEENKSVVISGVNADFMTVTVSDKATYKVNEAESLERINPVVLPGPLDDDYFAHASVIRNPGQHFTGVTILDFKAEVLREDGTGEPVEVKMISKDARTINEQGFFGKAIVNEYWMSQVSEGAVLRVSYRYSFPFRENWRQLLSMRFFFHGELAREKYTFYFEHPEPLFVTMNYINDADPDEITKSAGIVGYRWEKNDLLPALGETGSRPYTDLPWVSVNPLPWDMLYVHFDSFEEKFVSPWYFLIANREEDIRLAYEDGLIGTKDKDNLCFQRIADKFIKALPDDSSGLGRLRLLQQWMVDSTGYDEAFSFYDMQETYKRDRPCSYLAGGRIRDNSIEFAYANIMMKLDLPFFTGYLVDKRYGAVTTDYFEPVKDNDLLYAVVLGDQTLVYLHPKTDRSNYYCEELPFYYEGTDVLLIYTLDYAGYKRNFYEEARFMETPGSGIKDNYRKLSGKVKVNTKDDSMYFQTRVTLSGQYSTLMRPVYLDRPGDTTIHPAYSIRPWLVGGKGKLRSARRTDQLIHYPFRANFELEYDARGLISGNGDPFLLDLEGLLNHVIIDDLDSSHRLTDFYNDFPGTDSYAYMLEFDRPVSFRAEDYNMTVTSEYATYAFSVTQPSDKSLLVQSCLMISNEKVPARDVGKMAEVFNAAASARRTPILFKIE